jgi:flagellar hook-associated protein 2
MANVSSLGVGSGLDLQGLLENLMKVERQPLTVLQQQVSSFNTKISALGTLTSKLSALQTAAQGLKPAVLQSPLDKFATYAGKVGNEDVAGVSVGEGAGSGKYNLEVTQLAQAQKLRIDGDDVNIGGELTFSFAGDPTKDFSVTPGGSTLAGVAQAINQAGKGVTATVVNSATDGPQLVLTSEEGEENAFTVGGAGFSGTATVVQGAQDAKLKLDGIEISSASNTVKDVVSGVTLDLKATNVGAPTTLTVTAEHGDKIKAALESFVKTFNDSIASIKSLGTYDKDKPEAAGALNGNRVLREAQTALRNLVFGESEVLDENGEQMALSKLGITFQKDGTLKLDSDKLTAAINSNPGRVAEFAAEIGGNFNKGLDELVGTGGVLKIATDGYKGNVSRLGDRQAALELRMEKIEARYRSQFAALDTLVSGMNSTSSFLAQQLASISASTK